MRLDWATTLIQKFGNIVKTQRTTEAPSTPGFHVVRNIPNVVYITDEKQKLYRSGVGMLLYLVKIQDQIYQMGHENCQR